MASKTESSVTIWGTARPPAPADSFVYDAVAERAGYCRSLLSAADLHSIEEEIKKSGFMTIVQVREIIKNNTVKESMDARGETYAIDPEFMMVIDTRTNYKVFIAGDNVYTREELYEHLPFHDLGTDPESVFVQQEIGVFPARKYALDSDEFEYVARDVGDETVEFVMIEDMVGQAARKNYKSNRAPVKIVKTKIYLGKEKWDDFCLVHRVAKGIVNVTGGTTRSPFLAAMLQGPQARPMLMDEATILDQHRRMEEGIKRREEEAARREEEAKRREEANRKMELKLQADLARIETLMHAMKDIHSARATRAHKPAAPSSAADAAPSDAPPPATSSRDDNVADGGSGPLDDDDEILRMIRGVDANKIGRPAESANGGAQQSDDSVPL